MTKNKNYTIYINKKPFKVDRKTYICHCTGVIKGIQTEEFYNKFLLEYVIGSRYNAANYLSFYLNKRVFKGSIIGLDTLLDSGFNSIVWLANMADAFCGKFPNDTDLRAPEYYNYKKVVEYSTNYYTDNFSKEYYSLGPLMQFYYSFIYKACGNNLCSYNLIYPEDINRVLKQDYKVDFSYEDIKEDLNKHLIWVEIEGVWHWADKGVVEWLRRADYTDIYTSNLFKSFRSIKFESTPRSII